MKPIAYYGTSMKTPEVGSCAWLDGVSGHRKVKGMGYVITSPVVRVGAWGEFETENTIYRPEAPIHDDEADNVPND